MDDELLALRQKIRRRYTLRDIGEGLMYLAGALALLYANYYDLFTF